MSPSKDGVPQTSQEIAIAEDSKSVVIQNVIDLKQIFNEFLASGDQISLKSHQEKQTENNAAVKYLHHENKELLHKV